MIDKIMPLAYLYCQIVVILMYIYCLVSHNPKYLYSKTFNWLTIGTCIVNMVIGMYKKGGAFDFVLIVLNILVIYWACKRLSTDYKNDMYDEDGL